MKFTIKTSTSIPKNWDENLLKNLFSTGYQQSSWGTVYEKSFNLKVECSTVYRV